MTALRALSAMALLAFVLATLSHTSVAAAAEFGLTELEVSSTAKNGAPAVQAGSHPYAVTTRLALRTKESPLGSGEIVPVGSAKDVNIVFPPGFAGNPTAVPRCTVVQFLSENAKECPDASAVGTARIEVVEFARFVTVPVYSLDPAPGSAGKLGFNVEGLAPVVVDLALNPNPPYNVVVRTTNIAQGALFFGAQVTIWGVPAAASHDSERGRCALSHASCDFSGPEKPFITLPTSCAAPLSFGFEADSWQDPSPPGVPYPFQETVTIHDNSVPPNDLSPSGCAKLEFAPRITAQPTSSSAESPTGLDFDLDVKDEGISNPAEEATAASTIKKAVVTLPEGMTINPSQAEGLGTCSEVQLAEEQADPDLGEGCPGSSKIGTVEVQSPLLEGETLSGALFVATPIHNPFGSLIALYMVFRDPELGIIVRQAGKVEPDTRTGQLITTFDGIPQLPFSHFHLHFREGGRSPLVTPPTCGTYTATAQFTPWSNPASTYPESSSFKVSSGVGGGACPQAGLPPFQPGFEAGTINNAAASYSPVYMRLTRKDGEQDMTRFSAILPPGLTGKIAGVAKCPDSAIEAAKLRSGLQEKAAPSCPASSQIGRVLAGAGVGSELTYVPGTVYLAGPYHGAPLSVAVITPAVAGPFDVGTVVVREGLNLNPTTAQVEVDGAASDPIPHILAGIPLKLRDLRIYAERPNFTLNPTNCEEESFAGTLFGGGADVFSSVDDLPVALGERFQAADCASLGFKPKLALTLKGGTSRNDHPSLKAVLTPHAGDANIASVSTILPHSEFIDPERISNPCTRVQFNENACPPTSVLGTAKAWSPLLDEPLEGPVYFRSNGGERKVPDLVADVHGEGFRIIQVGFIDSVKARIRTRFLSFPDAPVSKIVLTLKGGKKGVLVNSADLCAHTRHVKVAMGAQNGRRLDSEPVLKVSCKKQARRSRRHD